MTTEALKARIESFEAKIAKAQSIIEKKQQWIDKKKKSLVPGEDNYYINSDIRSLESDINNKQKEIAEYQKSLDGYKAEFEKATSVKRDIPALVEFLNNWKNAATKYYSNKRVETDRTRMLQRIDDTYKTYAALHKESESEQNKLLASVNWNLVNDEKVWKEYNDLVDTYQEKEKAVYKEYRNAKVAYEREYVDVILWENKARYNRTTFEIELEKSLQYEWEKKYDKLVKDVTDVIGDIISMEDLRVSARGELNGTVRGTKGTCKVTTFLAGTDCKTHSSQQCLHFRCKVTKIKET